MEEIPAEVILVDTKDHPCGVMEKIKAHKEGKLHRAVSVVIFNSRNEMLIHRRAVDKYHSAGLWTNATCSHPMPMEQTHEAARRRLREEMGLKCELLEVFTFVYKATFQNGLIEHELDHLFVGWCDDEPQLNPDEVMDYQWVKTDDLQHDITKNPQKYTVWFKLIMQEHYDKIARLLNETPFSGTL